jgi:hypothetical protein
MLQIKITNLNIRIRIVQHKTVIKQYFKVIITLKYSCMDI